MRAIVIVMVIITFAVMIDASTARFHCLQCDCQAFLISIMMLVVAVVDAVLFLVIAVISIDCVANHYEYHVQFQYQSEYPCYCCCRPGLGLLPSFSVFTVNTSMAVLANEIIITIWTARLVILQCCCYCGYHCYCS